MSTIHYLNAMPNTKRILNVSWRHVLLRVNDPVPYAILTVISHLI